MACTFLLFPAAAVWGFAFVAQSAGGDAAGPFTFNTLRSLLGALVLLPVIAVLDRTGSGRPPQNAEERKKIRLFRYR